MLVWDAIPLIVECRVETRDFGYTLSKEHWGLLLYVTVYAKTNHMSAKIFSRFLLVREATNVLNDRAKF